MPDEGATTNDDALADAAAGFAHELNNGLAAIMNLAQLARMKSGSDEVGALLGEVEQAGLRTAELVGGLALLARPGGGEPRAVPLAAAVHAGVLAVRCRLRDARVAVEVAVPRDLPPAHCPAGLLPRVVADALRHAAAQGVREVRIDGGAEVVGTGAAERACVWLDASPPAVAGWLADAGRRRGVDVVGGRLRFETA